MSSDSTKSEVVLGVKKNTSNPSSTKRDVSGSVCKLPKNKISLRRSQTNSSDEESSTEEEGGLNMMEEIGKAFEKAFETKFSRIEQRMMAMEEQNDKMYKIVSHKDYTSNRDDSIYREMIDLIEQNTEDQKQTSKSLEALNAKQNDLIENTQDLIEKTTRLQKTMRIFQKNNPVEANEKIHSDRLGTTSGGDETSLSKSHILDLINRMDSLNSFVDGVQEQMDSWVKYSNENNTKMRDKIMSMAQAVEATTVEGRLMHDQMTKRMDNVGSTLEKRLVCLIKAAGKEADGTKAFQDNIAQVVNNIEDTISQTLMPLIQDTHQVQKGTLGEGSQIKETLEKLHTTVMETRSNDQKLYHEQSLENLANIMESLSTLNQETSSLQGGINDILHYKLTEDFVQGMCQMMIDQKTILENVDKKALSNISNAINDVKLSDVKVNLQLKELKSICSTLCNNDTLKDIAEDIKGVHIKHLDVAADIKKYEGERFDEIKSTLLKLQKAQTKVGGKQSTPKKKADENSDQESVHSMLLQMEIKKSSSEQTKLISKIDAKLQEMSENQASHNNWMTNFRTSVDCDLNTLKKKFDSKANSQDENSGLEDKIKSCFAGHSSTISDEFKKNSTIQTEILNSIEDLKILTSSMPNTVNDLVPVIEKVLAEIESFPDDVNKCFAGLEENLCANLEGRVKQITSANLKETCDRFDLIEQRLLVIRKYVKYGGGGVGSSQSDQGNDIISRDENKENNYMSQYNDTLTGLLDRIEAVYTTAEKTLNSSTAIKNDIDQLGRRVPSIADIQALLSDEKIQLTSNEVSKQLGTACKDSLDLPLANICEVQHQILEEQAKAEVVEDQLEALISNLANMIMPKIQELKAIEVNLIGFCENSLRPIIEAQNSNSNKDNIACIDVESQEDIEENHSPKNLISKQPSSIQQLKESRICNSSISERSETISPGIKGLINDTFTKTYVSPTTSNANNAVSRSDQRERATPSQTRKRSPSCSTDDSIIDTNSEAQDIGEMAIDSLKQIEGVNKKYNLDRNVRQWGPKRRRPGYIENKGKDVNEKRNNKASLSNQEIHGQGSKWQANGFFENDFDCSSIVSEDVF